MQDAPPAPPPPDDAEDSQARPSGKMSPAEVFAAGVPIAGTHAAAYLEARGLAVSERWTCDLRFAPALPYWGHEDADATDARQLGAFPALLAAIRDATGNLIGVHRTWLDPSAPRKLKPPGDPKRNAAKKVLGKAKGGFIRLSPPGPLALIGEGIETARAGWHMGIGGGDAAVLAAVNLGNLAGKATGTAPHPNPPAKNPRLMIPNGEPDLEHPGMILPAEVEEAILLGDGDSDAATTRAFLLVAGRRFRAAGRRVLIAMAPDGMDWNDAHRANAREDAA